MHICSGVSSSVGRKRTRNEDFPVTDDELGLFVVIDGMGGHARGDVASKVIGETIHKIIADTRDSDRTWPFEFDVTASLDTNRMRVAITMADRELARRIGADESLRGMGATMAGVLVSDGKAVVSNVGDCRTYLVRGGTIRQVTSDHSWVAEQVRNGLIQAADAKHHPLRNLVTRALAGGEHQVQPDLRELTLEHGDRLLLCSDGLHGLVNDDELLQRIDEFSANPQGACDTLIEMANERGAPDNVTAIVVGVSR
ncbi:MAG: PP2C family protein-serine/threonine phosphatase [Betaproteobacteria bacterium]